MESYLNQISAFLINMKNYPVAAALTTLAFFALLARITDLAVHRMLKSFCKKSGVTIEEKLLSIIHHPIWVVMLLIGASVMFRWLDLLPQYQYAVRGVFRTLLLLVVVTTINRFLKTLFGHWRDSREGRAEVINKMEGAAQIVLFFASLALLLAIWRINPAPFITSAGIIGIVVAIAAKDSLSNLFGGLSIALDKPFKDGDYIVLDTGERGKVTWVGFRSTPILTRDDVQITIPNAILSETKIINESAPFPRYRIRIKVGVAYGTDIDMAEETLLEVARENQKISKFPEPRVRFREFGNSALEFELLCWARQPQDRGMVIHQLGKTIYKAFQKKGITIPFPQQDIYVHSSAGNPEGTTEFRGEPKPE